MNVIRRTRAGLHVLVLIISVLLLLILHVNGNAQNNQTTSTGMPDVLIIINAQGANGHWVSITYPKLVSRSVAEGDLSRLLASTKWSAANTNISDGSIEASGSNPMTSVDFLTPQAVDPNTGAIPLEPVILAFKGYSNIEIDYLVPQASSLRALGNYDDKYVAITLDHGDGAYKYKIHVKNSGFDRLNLPLPDINGQTATTKNGKSTSRTVGIILITIVAIMVAAFAFLLTSKSTRRSRQ